MQRWLDRQKSPPFKRPMGKRIRLGIVSGDIRLHSVWMALIKGWFQSFDLERFELVVFSLADQVDPETSWARSKSDVFVGGPKTLAQWAAAMREQNCEILLYPAVGLHPMALKLASLRLAPVQINTWGHPDTSGLPTLDYYVSAQCFEPVDAQDHYSEQLVLLPNLGNRIQPLALTDSDPGFAALNIDLERPILVCPELRSNTNPNTTTYLPRSPKVPDAQLVFFRPSVATLTNLLEDRITKQFEAAGLNVTDHVRFIRWLNFHEFHCLLRRAHVMLDTIGFSGYNTAVQAIECGLPLVTREGRFLRGRLASGVLRRMELTELIAETKAEYVNLVVRLVTDREYQGAHPARDSAAPFGIIRRSSPPWVRSRTSSNRSRGPAVRLPARQSRIWSRDAWGEDAGARYRARAHSPGSFLEIHFKTIRLLRELRRRPARSHRQEPSKMWDVLAASLVDGDDRIEEAESRGSSW